MEDQATETKPDTGLPKTAWGWVGMIAGMLGVLAFLTALSMIGA